MPKKEGTIKIDPPIYNNIFEESFYGYVKSGSRKKFVYIREHSLFGKMKGKSKLIPSLLVLIMLFAGSFFAFNPSGATMSHFYPSSCLGGWSNPSNAQGRPQVAGKSAAYYNESNSAVLKDKISQIYCGGFDGEIPQDSRVQKVTLKLSWAHTTIENLNIPRTVTNGVYEPEDEEVQIPEETIDEEEQSGEVIDNPDATSPVIEPEPVVDETPTGRGEARGNALDGILILFGLLVVAGVLNSRLPRYLENKKKK